MGFSNIKIVYLHGSTEWMYCPRCGNIYSPPSYQKTNLDKKLKNSTTCKNCRKKYKIDEKSLLLTPLLVMPTFLKKLSNLHLQDIWRNAAVDLQETKRLVIIGYSLLEADFLIRNLFVKNLSDDIEIHVILKHTNRIERDIKINYKNILNKVTKRKRDEVIQLFLKNYKTEKYFHYTKFFGEKNFPISNIHFSGTKYFLDREIKLIKKVIT